MTIASPVGTVHEWTFSPPTRSSTVSSRCRRHHRTVPFHGSDAKITCDGAPGGSWLSGTRAVTAVASPDTTPCQQGRPSRSQPVSPAATRRRRRRIGGVTTAVPADRATEVAAVSSITLPSGLLMIAGGGGGGGTYSLNSAPQKAGGGGLGHAAGTNAPGTAGNGRHLSAGGAAGDRGRLVPQATAAQATVVVAEAVVASTVVVAAAGPSTRVAVADRAGPTGRSPASERLPVAPSCHRDGSSSNSTTSATGSTAATAGLSEARMVMTADTPMRPDPQGVERHPLHPRSSLRPRRLADRMDRRTSRPARSRHPPPWTVAFWIAAWTLVLATSAAAAITGHDRCTAPPSASSPSSKSWASPPRSQTASRWADSSGKSEPRSSACGAPPCSPHRCDPCRREWTPHA